MLPEQREKLLKSTPGWIQVNEGVTKHVQLRWTQKSLDARIDAEGARADRGGGTDKAVGKADRLLKQLTSFIGRYRCTLGIEGNLGRRFIRFSSVFNFLARFTPKE